MLSTTELVAVLLGSGVKGKNALELAGNVLPILRSVTRSSGIEKLLAIDGVGETKAARITAAFELARRYSLDEGATISSSRDAVPFFRDIFNKKQEYFACMSLNGANEVIETRIVTVGLLNSNQVHPREVFSDPIEDRAASIIVAHNHPSGNLDPSPEDISITERLKKAGKILGIEVLDHIIVTRKGHTSLKRSGLL